METNLNEVQKLVAQSKKLKDASSLKHELEDKLSELTLCNNLAVLSRKRKLFRSKVLKLSCKVVCNSITSVSQYNQTLVIIVENISEKFRFSSENWQFYVSLNNGSTQCMWNLEKSFNPGQTEKFCCPLDDLNFQSPLLKVGVSLKFTIQFESKTYVRTFDIHESIIDILHCLDPSRLIYDTRMSQSLQKVDFTEFINEKSNSISFPPITKFLLRLGSELKDKFVKNILLCDSWHRGFETDKLCNNHELLVFYKGNHIGISFCQNSDLVSVKCSDPSILCAVKVAVLRRLVTIRGINVEELDDGGKEKIHHLRLKLNSLQIDSADILDVDDLMEFYLELRDISESIRFSVIDVVGVE